MACLLAPYAVKNQIIFNGTKIAIVLERGRGRGKIPKDEDIRNISHLNGWAGGWAGFAGLKSALDAVSDQNFARATKDFRHRHTHRMPPRIGMGIVPNFRLKREGVGLRIHPHMDGPLELSTAIDAAVVQHRACVAAFRAFWSMLKVRLATI
jgi:hypothetical protein